MAGSFANKARTAFAAALTLFFASDILHAYQIVQPNPPLQPQAETRDPTTGRITVEASIIYVVACNSPGENGGEFYIYHYTSRAGDQPTYRAILPPNWGNALGGRDYNTFEQATAIACGVNPSLQPVVQPPPPPPPPMQPLQPAPVQPPSSDAPCTDSVDCI